MSSSLLSNSNSQQQYQANILTNRPNLVKVLVEDEEDVVVWHKILKKWRPDKIFEITPYFHDASVADSKGKSHILKMGPNFGPYFIGCVDSDYDYLLELHTADGLTMRSNPYILQTFGYAIENLACQPYGLSDTLFECLAHCSPMQRDADAHYSAFITEVSKILYPVLIWHLVLKKENRPAPNWDEVIGNDHYRPILADHSMPLPQRRAAVLQKLAAVAAAAETLYAAAHPDLAVVKTALEADIKRDYALAEDNAYMYVRGHDLYDFLLFTFFDPLYKAIREEHISTIRTALPAPEIESAIEHYRMVVTKFIPKHIHSCAFLADTANHITTRLGHSVSALPF